MDSEVFTEKVNYQLKTISDDLLKFTNLRAWRRVLIEDEIKNPNNVDDKNFGN